MSRCPVSHEGQERTASSDNATVNGSARIPIAQTKPTCQANSTHQPGSWWRRLSPECGHRSYREHHRQMTPALTAGNQQDFFRHERQGAGSSARAPGTAGQCPVQHSNRATIDESQINPRNMMPLHLPQTPLSSSAQRYALETNRTLSTIPRGSDLATQAHDTAYATSSPASGEGEEDQHWVYPSQQQFYNALARKGYETDEKDIPVILAIHNDLNEQSWSEVCKWEKQSSSCTPKLLRFMGKPTTLSPKARFFTFFGSPKPFDRHDWIVERCGKPVRYILDYYEAPHVPGKANFFVDCRPAADSIDNVWARAKRVLGLWSAEEGKPTGNISIA